VKFPALDEDEWPSSRSIHFADGERDPSGHWIEDADRRSGVDVETKKRMPLLQEILPRLFSPYVITGIYLYIHIRTHVPSAVSVLEANSPSVKELLFMEPKAHCVHKSPSLVPSWDRRIQFTSSHPTPLTSILLLLSHVLPGLPNNMGYSLQIF
jgi:hypothetical protein